jgi:serine/threonine-protein kinase
MSDPKIIAPRPPTPAPGTPTGGPLTSRLPDDMMADQVRRLAMLSAVLGGLWTYGLTLDLFVFRAVLPDRPRNAIAIGIEIAAIAISALMFLHVRYGTQAPERKATLGLFYMIANAVGVALLDTWATSPVLGESPTVSWIAVLVLVFSMISPTSPRRMLAASLVAASMDPLGVWAAHLRGEPVPPPLLTMLHFMPNYLCAIVAVLPARILQRLGRQLRQAQAMGSYRLVERLGQGGMGEVWRARHRLLARTAAIKLVRPEVLGSTSDLKLILRRFEREAQATAALSSPHTIQLFDFGVTDEGSFYYVMELLSGRDLETLIREFGPLPADRAVYLLRQVCHSLADAHARGLVHRDIKPANIYVCRMGLEYDFVKVLDFGLVKFNDRGPRAQTLTTMDHTTGTPAYMAPEIILGEADVDRRADVYALGCVAYFLLTGQLVFEGDTSMKVLLQHVQAPPVPPSHRTELPIPRELDELVLACLQKDPERRPQNAEELFHMACDCRTTTAWNQQLARAWWETHLPELTGPLTLDEVADAESDERRAAFIS